MAEPPGQRRCQLLDHLRVVATALHAHVEGVVGVVDHVQRGAFAQGLHHGPQQLQPGQLVARALQEQHRQPHLLQVLGARG